MKNPLRIGIWRVARLLFIIAVLIPAIDGPRTTATPYFRGFDEDRPRLDRYVEEAKKEEDPTAFEDIMRRGREALRAEWERNAEQEIERTLREEGEPEGLREELEIERREAFAVWERGVDDHIAGAEGSWYARRQDIAFGELESERLRKELADAGDAANMAEWEERTAPAINEIGGAWEEALDERILAGRARVGDLPGTSRQAYEDEISRIERELRTRFSLEKNTLVFEAKNSFITDRFIDSDSLRRQSEATSADSVAENIIARVRGELEGEEEKLLPREATGDSGEGQVDLSKLGENWRQELESLVERGMNRWREAQDLLYREMTAWKAGSEEAFEAGDAAWQRSYEKLFEAKDAWRTSIEREIGEAVDRWREKEESLAQNLAQARADFNEYMSTLNDQWNAHAYGLREMALAGSRLHAEAVETVEWLNRMLAQYEGTPAFQNDSESLRNIIDSETGNRMEQALDSIEKITKYFPAIPPFTTAKILYQQSGELSIKYMRSEYDQEENALTEYYRVEVRSVERQYEAGQFGLDGYYRTTATIVDSFEWTNTMTGDSPAERKSAWYFYKSELLKWSNIETEFGDVIIDAENAMHDANMLGEDNGPGFLVNADGQYAPNESGENDPYLLTEAETEFRRASRERDYWRQRFTIAQAVRDYARADAARGSAETTERARSGALAAMDTARQDYESRCVQVKGIAEELRAIQGLRPADESSPGMDEYRRSIEYLTEELAKARAALENESENYLIWKRAVIMLENGQDVSFLVEEIKEIEENLLRVEKDIREKSVDYYLRSREYERLSRLEGYAGLYRETALSHARAKQAFTAYSSVVRGAEDDTSLLLWAEGLETGKAVTWGEGAEERYGTLCALKEAFEIAPDAEKDVARQALAGFFRSEYGRLEGIFETATEALRMLENKGFDARAFLSETRSFDTEEYRTAAVQNRDAFARILQAMDSIEDAGGWKSHAALMEKLESSLSGLNYVYGGENRDYAAYYAACRWAQQNTGALGEENWDAMKDALSQELDAAGAIQEMYESYDEFDPESIRAAADSGDETSRRVLREYHERGSMMAMLPFITACDDSCAQSENRYAALRDFAATNETIFASRERAMGETDYYAELLDYVNSRTPGLVLSEEGLQDLGIDELAAAAALAEEYLAGKHARGEAVPAACRDLAARIAQKRERIQHRLYPEEGSGDKSNDAIIDTANDCSRDLMNLLNASRRETIEEPGEGAATIDRFIDLAHEIYNEGGNYAADTEGRFGFEAALDSLVSRVSSLASGKKTALADLNDELFTAEATRESSRARIASVGKTLSQMRESGGSLEVMRRQLMSAASAHAASEARYASLEGSLRERRDEYRAKNDEYLAAMNGISSSYASYKEREYQYELANAIWEYAHTPYLKIDASQDSGLAEDTIVPPDAEQNLRTIEERYTLAQARYLEAESRLQSQETIESLLSDPGYAKRRADFIRKSGSFARTAQATALLTEALSRSKAEYEAKKEAYETARNNSLLFNANDETDPDKLLRRDILLERLIGDGGARIEGYMQTLPHYVLNMPVEERMRSELAELETQFNPGLFNDMRLLAAQYLIVGQTNIKQAEIFLFALIVKIDSVRSDLRGILARRSRYESAKEGYDNLHSLHNLSQVSDLLKDNYGLTGEETDRTCDAWDGSPGEDGEGVNLSALRRLERRRDIDGNGVKAIREGDAIYLLEIDGTRSMESFALDDTSIVLHDESGNTIKGDDMQAGVRYDLYDFVYCGGEICRVLCDRFSAQREEYRAGYERYIAGSAESGTHDRTVMLRDLESQYWKMITNAISFGAERGETRQRSFEGYRTLLNELLNGSGSVHGRIVSALSLQNAILQDQEWEHRTQSLQEKKRRWMETVGFIHTRGMRDWTTSLNDFTNQWMKWRIDARATIEAGEHEYVSRAQNLSRDMKAWGEDAGKAISAESEERSYLELSERMNDCVSRMREDLPETVKLDIDTEAIMARTLEKRSVSSIGMLSSSMESVSTVTGFTELLNLNLNSSLHARFAQDMKSFKTQMSVMQNLRAADVLNSVIEGFNTQLAELNAQAFERVVPDIRSRYAGPFARHLPGRMWIIDVVKGVSDGGKRYREMFWTADYQNFRKRLTMKTLRGLSGSDVDFLRPATLQAIDPQELEIYVRLENDHLNGQIQSILGAGGSYPTHVSNEYQRLDLWFDHYDGEYRKGEAMRKPAWHETETFKYIKLGQELLLPDLVLKGALDTAIGAEEGGWLGGGLAGLSAVASAPIELATADNADMGVSYSYDRGYGFNTRAQGEYYGFKGGVRFNYTQADNASFSTFGGYGRGGIGAEMAMNYSYQEGFGGSTGVRLASSNQNASLYAGVTYSQKNKFGLQATATIKSGQSSLSTGMEWNQREGFSASMDARVGMFTAGAGYNFTKGDLLSARMGFDYGYGDSPSGLKGSAGLGFSYTKDQGYTLSMRNNMSMHTDAETAANGLGGMNMNMAGMINFSENGRLIGSNSSSSFKIYDEYEYNKWREKQIGINPFGRDAEKTKDNMDMMDKIELAVSGIWESIKGGLSRAAEGIGEFFERTGNLFAYGEFSSNESDDIQMARDTELSKKLWESGAMDAMIAINKGRIAGEYAFLGDDSFALMLPAPAFHTDSISFRNEKGMSIYDINDALTTALTGGHRTGDLNENMQALCLLNGAKDASELQRMIRDGSVSINDIAQQAGLAGSQMAEFAKVLGVAGGIRNGTIFEGRNGYYAGNGQLVAGRWNEPGATYLNPYEGPYISNGVQVPKISGSPGTTITLNYDTLIADVNGRVDLLASRDLLIYQQQMALAKIGLIGAATLAGAELLAPVVSPLVGEAVGALNLGANAARLYNAIGGAQALTKAGLDMAFGGVQGFAGYAIDHVNDFDIQDALAVSGIQALAGLGGSVWGMYSSIPGATIFGREINSIIQCGGTGFIGGFGNLGSQLYLEVGIQEIIWSSAAFAALTSMSGRYISTSQSQAGYSQYWYSSGLAKGLLFIPSISGSWMINTYWKDWEKNHRK